MSWQRRNPSHQLSGTPRHSALWKRRFDSGEECRYADHLYARRENGEIELDPDQDFQVTIRFSVRGVDLGITHKVDFRYIELSGIPPWVGDGPLLVHDEYKGKQTAKARDWLLKKKLYAAGAGERVEVLKVTTLRRSSKIEPFHTEWIVARKEEERNDGR